MRYSLINVDREKDGFVDGNWVQDYTGTLEGAIKCARETENINSGRINIAVVDEVNKTNPVLSYYSGRKRLD